MFGFDWDGAPASQAPTRRAATQALVARMDAPPDAARVAAIDKVIATLSDAGIWSKLDILVVPAAHHAQTALLNWKGAAYSAATVGAPVFVVDRGFFTDGSDDAIDWGWTPAGGMTFGQTNAMFGAWFRRSDRNPVSPLGTQSGTSCTLSPRSATDTAAGRINSATVSGGGAVTTGYGLTLIDRSGAGNVQIYRDGLALGPPSTAASGTRSAATMASGKANGVFAEGQYCAHVAGGSLSAPEHAVLADALAGYMATVGATPLPMATRTLAMNGAWPLPDGDHPVATGGGMGATGLARDPIDGCWWVGNGIATTQSYAGVTRLSPDFSTILGSYDVAGWGLGSSYNGSMQGVAFDTSDSTVWGVLKGTAGGAVLLHIARSGALIGAPIALPQANANGIAYDAATDRLAILHDTAPAPSAGSARPGTTCRQRTRC